MLLIAVSQVARITGEILAQVRNLLLYRLESSDVWHIFIVRGITESVLCIISVSVHGYQL
jgi:hypothetical protein